MITIGALFIVVGAVEKSHIVDWLARKTFGTKGSDFVGKARMYTTCFLLSVFFNNTPLVAILQPVVKDWGRMRNIAASQLLIPLSYSVLAGSFGSMIGTSSNLTVNGLMQADRGYSFNFFAPAPIGFLIFFGGMLGYQLAAGPYLLPDKKVGLIRTYRDKASSMMAEIYVAPKSFAAGKCIGEVMNALGVSPSAAIKIRRRVMNAGASTDNAHAESATPASRLSSAVSKFGGNIMDMKYVRDMTASWTSKGTESAAPAHTADKETDSSQSTSSLDFSDIIAPAYHELVAAHDVIFVSSAQEVVQKMMKSIAGESKGLFLLNSNALALPGFGSEIVEFVVSDTNPFLGQRVADFSAAFAEKYKTAIITVRGKDWQDMPTATASPASEAPAAAEEGGAGIELVASKEGYDTVQAVDDAHRPIDLENVAAENLTENGSASGEPANAGAAGRSVSEHVLGYGDIILGVTSTKQVDELAGNRDFFVVSTVGALPKPLDWFKCIPIVVFIAMLILAATESIDMCSASLSAATLFLLGGWVTSKEIPQYVDVKLLFLIGSSISFAKSVTKTGLAVDIAKTISHTNGGPLSMLFLIYALTLAITELITNNAAGSLMYPIAVALADEIGVSYKPFAMAVMIACTAGFMSPIGYQTHMMVWAPGGYSFKDFMVFGLVPNLMYWGVSCLIIPALFPF
jgi:di/tricarboxylate transporter